MAAIRPARASVTARRSSARASRRTSTGRVRRRVRTTATPTSSRTTRSPTSATSSAGRTRRVARLGPDAGTRGRAARALPAVARGGLSRGRGGGRAACGADGVVTRLALARAPARRDLDLATGLLARAAAQGRRVGLLESAAGWLIARTVAEHPTGDHTFFVGEIVSIEEGRAPDSLTYVHHTYKPV